jgi:hypothetical protein
MCKVKGCDRKLFAKELCCKHYCQMRREGRIIERTCKDPNEIELKEKYALLHLYDIAGSVVAKVKIDIEDIPKISKYRWCSSGGYPFNNTVGMLHDYLFENKILCDHKNRKPLDCRKKNLREATHKQNNHNRSKMTNNSSGVKGVNWNTRRNKWVASIMVDYKRHRLGGFDNLLDAARAYKRAALQLHGEFAHFTKIKDVKKLLAA